MADKSYEESKEEAEIIWRKNLENERTKKQQYSHAVIQGVLDAMSQFSPEVTARLLLRLMDGA